MRNSVLMLAFTFLLWQGTALMNPAAAQCDCDPFEIDMVCVEVEGQVVPFINACLAECLELEIVDEDCVGDVPGDFGCDCDPFGDDGGCVLTPLGDIVFFPSLCLAECLGLEAVDADCGYDDGGGDGGGDDWGCDCDDSDLEEYCVFDPWYGDVFEVVANECMIECWELEIVDCEDGGDDGGDDGSCNCDDTGLDLYCVYDPWFDFSYEIEANECLLECWELEIIDCDDIDDPWEECDCDWNDYSPVCVELDDGTLCQFYNACEAECYGYFDYTDGECDYDWGDDFDCDCDWQGDDEIVCVMDEFGFVFPFPGACLAECLGFEIVDGDCDDPWGDGGDGGDECDCPEDEEPGIYCVMEPFGDEIFVMEGTVCWIEDCLGCIIVDCDDNPDDGGDGGDGGDECDCPEDEEPGIYCVMEPFGDEIFVMEGTVCWIEDCLGCIIVDCDDNPDDGGDDWDCGCSFDDIDTYCVYDWWFDEVYEIEANECLLECWELEIVDCDDNGEGGDGGDEWNCGCELDQLEVYCVFDWWSDEVFEIEANECLLECWELEIVDCDDGGEGPGFTTGNGPNGIQVNTVDKVVGNLEAFPNPTSKDLTISYEAYEEALINIDIVNMTGQVVSATQAVTSLGHQRVEFDINEFEAGIYFVTLGSNSGTPQTIKVVKL